MLDLYRVVEKKNMYSVHGIFETKERAEYFLKYKIPMYILNGYFGDKTLTQDSFVIIERIVK